MKIEVFEYNSFCSDTFLGNPAGVCMDAGLSKKKSKILPTKMDFLKQPFYLKKIHVSRLVFLHQLLK